MITNNAEITGAENEYGIPDLDDDLAQVNGSSDDTSEVATDGDTADEVNNTQVSSDPGTQDNPNDEDSYDPAQLPVGHIFDVALKKTYAGYTDANNDGILNFGEDVIFDIEVMNQGTLDATDVIVTDYYPTGTTLSTADTNGWNDAGTSGTNNLGTVPT